MKRLSVYAMLLLTITILSGCSYRLQTGGWREKGSSKGPVVNVTVTSNVSNDLTIRVYDAFSHRYATARDEVRVHLTQLGDAPDLIASVDENGRTMALPVPIKGGNVVVYVEYRDLLYQVRTTQIQQIGLWQRGPIEVTININTNPYQQ